VDNELSNINPWVDEDEKIVAALRQRIQRFYFFRLNKKIQISLTPIPLVPISAQLPNLLY